MSIARPEQNGEFLVQYWTDVRADDGKLHNGFDIVYPRADINDYTLDNYKAEVVEKNGILVTRPSVPHLYRENFSGFFNKLAADGDLCQRAKEAHEVTQNAVNKPNSDRMWTRFLLRFQGSLPSDPSQEPKELVLSRKHYMIDGNEGTLSCEIVPFQTTTRVGVDNVTRIHDAVFWKVAIREDKPRIVARAADATPRGVAKLAARLAATSMGGDGA